MSALFTAASSHYLHNDASPITAVPFTAACWFRSTTVAAGAARIFTFTDTASTNNRFAISRDTNDLTFSAQAGGTEAIATVANLVAANQWSFIVARGISATNRRIAQLAHTGAAGHAQNTTSRAPGSVDRVALGSSAHSSPGNFFDGLIGEFWYTNTDIQADGAQLQDSLLRQLAWGGPFSVPHIAKDIIEYRSFRHGLVTDDDVHGDIHFGAKGLQRWTNTNGVARGPHPPLPYGYVKPTVNRQFAVI